MLLANYCRSTIVIINTVVRHRYYFKKRASSYFSFTMQTQLSKHKLPNKTKTIENLSLALKSTRNLIYALPLLNALHSMLSFNSLDKRYESLKLSIARLVILDILQQDFIHSQVLLLIDELFDFKCVYFDGTLLKERLIQLSHGSIHDVLEFSRFLEVDVVYNDIQVYCLQVLKLV